MEPGGRPVGQGGRQVGWGRGDEPERAGGCWEAGGGGERRAPGYKAFQFQVPFVHGLEVGVRETPRGLR